SESQLLIGALGSALMDSTNFFVSFGIIFSDHFHGSYNTQFQKSHQKVTKIMRFVIKLIDLDRS
ncbi:MAG: hypothetical protein ACPGXY_07045, partial [Alphaproteobacteria bacterium]